MQCSKVIHAVMLGLFALSLALVPACNTAKPYRETTVHRGWNPFLRPARTNPADQLVYAEQLREAGNIRAAMRQFRALTIFWPQSKEAPTAQYQYAQLLDDRKDYDKAFEEYQYLVDHYASMFPYDEVLNRQFTIAVHEMDRKRAKFLFLPGFSAPERAIPMLSNIVTNGPNWAKAAETQYLIGRAHELALDYEEAVAAYLTAQNRYPDSLFAEQACFGMVRCNYLLADESPNNEEQLETAWAGAVMFVKTYPKSEQRDAVEKMRDRLFGKRAKAAYDKAYYYDKIARKPKAALLAYDSLVKLFPQSEWTPTARQRIEILSNIAGEKHAK